jgi:hypothetical protein
MYFIEQYFKHSSLNLCNGWSKGQYAFTNLVDKLFAFFELL